MDDAPALRRFPTDVLDLVRGFACELSRIGRITRSAAPYYHLTSLDDRHLWATLPPSATECAVRVAKFRAGDDAPLCVLRPEGLVVGLTSSVYEYAPDRFALCSRIGWPRIQLAARDGDRLVPSGDAARWRGHAVFAFDAGHFLLADGPFDPAHLVRAPEFAEVAKTGPTHVTTRFALRGHELAVVYGVAYGKECALHAELHLRVGDEFLRAFSLCVPGISDAQVALYGEQMVLATATECVCIDLRRRRITARFPLPHGLGLSCYLDPQFFRRGARLCIWFPWLRSTVELA